MEKEREINTFLPQRYHVAEDLFDGEQSTANAHLTKTVSLGQFANFEAETDDIVRKISDLNRQEKDEKILVLRGSYGCGKSTFLKNIVDKIVKTKVFQ